MKQAQGLTIIELLVSIAILGVISAAILSFLPSLFQLNRSSTSDQEITIEAKRFMEDLRSSWQASSPSDWASIDSFKPFVPAAPTPAGHSCTTSVSDPDNLAANPIRLRVGLSCSRNGDGSTNPYNFVLELGRPS